MANQLIDNLAARIKARRLSKGMTQEAVARAASISVITYKRIEYAACNPTILSIYGIAAALGVPAKELV